MTNPTLLPSNFESVISSPARTSVDPEQASQRIFFGVSALLFVISAAETVLSCNSMSTMGAMPMPGSWTMSMMWMRMPGQTWAGATASFVCMWVVMMAAMMLPSVSAALWRFHQSIGEAQKVKRAELTTLAGFGYFFVWTLFGLAVFPAGVTLATFEMEQPALARAVPILAAVVVVLAGALQFTPWKAHHLACCREAPGRGRTLPADAGTAWQQGVRFGLHCGLSCANLTAILLVMGVMDLRAMVVLTVAITAERLAPSGKHAAWAIGAVVVGAGLLMIVKAM